MSASFQSPPTPQPLPVPPLWKQPWLWNLGRQLLGGVAVLLLIFGVLRKPEVLVVTGRRVY